MITSLITPCPPFLTIIDPVAQVALPPPLVQERDKGVDVGSAGPTPDNGAGCHHGKLLQESNHRINQPLCEKCLQANSFSCLQLIVTGMSIKTFLLLSNLCNVSPVCPHLTQEQLIHLDRFFPEVSLVKSYSEKKRGTIPVSKTISRVHCFKISVAAKGKDYQLLHSLFGITELTVTKNDWFSILWFRLVQCTPMCYDLSFHPFTLLPQRRIHRLDSLIHMLQPVRNMFKHIQPENLVFSLSFSDINVLDQSLTDRSLKGWSSRPSGILALLSRDWVWGMLVSVQRKTLETNKHRCLQVLELHSEITLSLLLLLCVPAQYVGRKFNLMDTEMTVLLWVTVHLLQVLGQAGCRGRDLACWQQVSLLQQVDHSQGLWGAGLEAHGRQWWAQLGWPWTTRWLRRRKKEQANQPIYQKLITTKFI